MKKLITLIVSMICMSVITYADNYDKCKVIGTANATVAVSVIDWDDNGNVTVEISSDCDDYVNLSFTLTLKNDRAYRGSGSYTVSAQPNSNTVKKYRLRRNNTDSITSVDVQVTGARCE